MSAVEEWESISHMARYSWKLTTVQVADAADTLIAELRARNAELSMTVRVQATVLSRVRKTWYPLPIDRWYREEEMRS
jgi:hypothetical protein